MQLKYLFSNRILEKLDDKHGVTKQEVIDCFFNSNDKTLEDKRENNISNPPTLWFIAETRTGRKLKICYVFDGKNTVYIKTAYEPSDTEIRIYNKYT